MDHLLRPMMRNQTGIGEWKMIRYLKESGRITGLVSKSTFFHDTKTLASPPSGMYTYGPIQMSGKVILRG